MFKEIRPAAKRAIRPSSVRTMRSPRLSSALPGRAMKELVIEVGQFRAFASKKYIHGENCLSLQMEPGSLGVIGLLLESLAKVDSW